MKWKEYPHLFANGKFKVEDYLGKRGIIQGCNHCKWFLIDPPKNHWVQVQGATLIARPIEDMTDEEVRNCPTFKKDDITPIEELRYRLFYWTYESYTELMPAIVQNYLLSIGVYPFDQEDFKSHIDSYMNGEPKYRPPLVIDARTLKQEESCQGSTE